jgi:hypothetical protein
LSGFKQPNCIDGLRAAWMLWFGPCGTDRTKHRVKKLLSLGGIFRLGLRDNKPAIRTAFKNLLGLVGLLGPLKYARSQALIKCSDHQRLFKMDRWGPSLDWLANPTRTNLEHPPGTILRS